jgi:hypothetical protein
MKIITDSEFSDLNLLLKLNLPIKTLAFQQKSETNNRRSINKFSFFPLKIKLCQAVRNNSTTLRRLAKAPMGKFIDADVRI